MHRIYTLLTLLLTLSLCVDDIARAENDPALAGLDALVAESLYNNAELNAARERWQQASYLPPQVGSLPDPVVSFALSNYPSDTLSASDTAMTGNELKLAQKFPFFGKLANRTDLAAEQARWFEQLYRDRRLQLARRVKDAWFRLYFNARASEVTERNLALMDDTVRLTEVRYETGSGLQQDVLKAQVQRSSLLEKQLSLRRQRATLQAELNRLLNRAVDAPVAVPQQLELPQVSQDAGQLEQSALQQRPLVNAYRALIKRFDHQKKLAELDDYPDVTLWASWRFRDDDLADEGTDFVSAGVSFNLPLYRDKRRAARAEALAARRNAEQQAESFRRSVTEAIDKAYAAMQESRDRAALYREGIIPQTTQAFQSAMSAYRVGRVEFISLLDALKATFGAEMEYHRAVADYLRNVAWLEAESTVTLVGAPLPEADNRVD
jgi:outer membrane protein TolC